MSEGVAEIRPLPDSVDRTAIDSVPHELRTTQNLGDFFSRVNDCARDSMLADRNNWPANIDPRRIENVITNKNFSRIDETDTKQPDAEYNTLLELASKKEKIARGLIKRTIEGENKLGLSDTEKAVVLSSCDLADNFDGFYFDWRKKIAAEPVDAAGKRLQPEGIEAFGPFVYSVFERDGNTVKAVPYAEAFPEHIGEIEGTINQTINKLRETDAQENEALIAYYTAFRTALVSPNPGEHEELWKQVDRALLKIKGRIQPLHMTEKYEDPLNLRITPNYALACSESEQEALHGRINQGKDTLQQYLNENAESFGEAVSSHFFDSSFARLATGFGGGRYLTSNPAAQILPDRKEIQEADGVKIFINPEMLKIRREEQKSPLRKVFGDAFPPAADEHDTAAIEMRAILMGMHEISHPLFTDNATRIAFGHDIYQDLEETKAEFAATAAAEGFSSEDQDLVIQNLIGISLLLLQRKDAPRPYRNYATAALTILGETGIVKQTEEGGNFICNLTEGTKAAFFKRMDEVFKKLITKVYQPKNQEEAKEFMSKYFKETPFIETLITKLSTPTT